MIACATPFHLLELWPLLATLPAVRYTALWRHMNPTTISRHFAAAILPAMVLFLIAALINCATTTPWQRAYTGLSVTSSLVEKTHENFWAGPLDARIVECDPATHPEIETETAYDECLGPFVKNPEVIIALRSFRVAQTTLTTVLEATDPATASADQNRQFLPLLSDVLQAAIQLLTLIPGGEKALSALDLITG